jgi:hypothetical protein
MKISAMFTLALITVTPSLVHPQMKSEVVSEFPKWEEYLKTAEITQSRQMTESEGVTRPWDLRMEKEGVNARACWKNVEGRQRGYWEGWKWEVAAYRLDQMLGLNMVPPTVERRFRGDKGSIQLWMDVKMDYAQKQKDKLDPPSYKVLPMNRSNYLRWTFDNLIANEDRHLHNILIQEDWTLILIDHSRSFRTSKKFTKKLIYENKMKQLPRDIYLKLKGLTYESIQAAMGSYLRENEIKAVIQRRDLMLKEIDARIAELGEDKVLYELKKSL